MQKVFRVLRCKEKHALQITNIERKVKKNQKVVYQNRKALIMKRFCRSAYDLVTAGFQLSVRKKLGWGSKKPCKKRIFIAKLFCADGFSLISLYFPL